MRIRDYLNLLSAIVYKKRFIYAHFGVTHRCNLKCRMCSIWNLADKEQELNLTQIRRLADTLRSIGVSVISLGGGEPFLREDLKELVKIFIQKGFSVRLLTNGLLVKKRDIRDLVKIGLRNISISLDTLSSGKQEYICNKKGVWDTIVNNMILISEIFPKRGSTLLVNTTVSGLNIKELPFLAKFVDRFGYYISYVPIELRGNCGICTEEPFSKFKIACDDYRVVDEIYGELLRMKRKDSNILNSSRFLENSCKFLKTGQKNWECDAGRLYFSLNPQGGFSICHNFKSNRESSHDIINYLRTEEFKSERLKLIEGCSGCMRPCWAEVTNFIRHKKSFWEMAKIEMSAWRKRKIDTSRLENLRSENTTYKSTN